MHDEHPVVIWNQSLARPQKADEESCASIAMPPPFEVATTEADSAVQFFEDFAHYLYHVPKRRTLCMSTKLKYTCLNRYTFVRRRAGCPAQACATGPEL